MATSIAMGPNTNPDTAPQHSPMPPAQGESGRSILTRKKSPVNVLMVDDQPSKLLAYEAILRELGENLVTAATGREALEQLLKGDIAVVLMDVSMPEIDGFELADMMRQHPRFQKIPIIFVSAIHLSEIDRIRGYQSGAVDYISVPVVPEVLRAKVSVFAELHRKTRELQELNRELEDRVAERSEELRRLNSQLQERVAELESIMQVLPIGVAVAEDPGCKIVRGNAAASEMLGLKQGDNLSAAARSLPAKIMHNGVNMPTAPPLETAIQTGRPTDILEVSVTKDNGAQLHMIASASPLFDDSGNVRGAVGAFFDVTERKHLEETLRERAELLELASEAIIVRDSAGTIHFWNAGAEALYGWPREEAVGRNIHQLLGTGLDVKDEFNAALEGDERWQGNLHHCTKDGREIIVASRQARKKNSALILEINRDITSQRLAEEALRRNDRLAAMGKVAGIVAHEINNPLAAITNTFYLLRTHPSLDEQAQYYAQLAEQELTRVSHIAKQTLSFYRESQPTALTPVHELIDSVLELQHRLLRMNRITLEKRYSSKELSVPMSVEMKQVFMNLVGNAIQAMPQGGRLRVSIGPAPNNASPAGVRIAVTDTGVGVQPEDAKRLFEPFFTTKDTKGTGLGLWISRGIVQKYDGTLSFRSVLGDGRAVTSFQVVVPATT
ncbi:MAG TPA: PAS domain S-box protein [Acidobacteriaceae bacterium]|nr:PAS domain S-box protein [Acidobacteriaceae bacterium]